MNERIKELIQQATRMVDGGPDLFSMPREIFDKELFAELIVQECAQIAEEVDGDRRAKKCVLEHFGVKE